MPLLADEGSACRIVLANNWPLRAHPWEITIAQLLSDTGYATAMYGKWHLGDREGRYPKDRGFDHWYGIPRTTNESMFTEQIGFDAEVVDIPHVMEGRRGAASFIAQRIRLVSNCSI